MVGTTKYLGHASGKSWADDGGGGGRGGEFLCIFEEGGEVKRGKKEGEEGREGRSVAGQGNLLVSSVVYFVYWGQARGGLTVIGTCRAGGGGEREESNRAQHGESGTTVVDD